ncbi:MAG: N-acetylglutaminylglutamine amidotransferase [Chromatiales bacterium]|jgi:asparagine synthase (glutamine-hydrolysing)
MCGICGELRFDGRAPRLEDIRRMLDRLARRGPDHEGTYSDGPLALGHRRLSIIDLSEHAHQPMVDPELRLALSFNGTIYNYRELRSELQTAGYHFFSNGDSEVIIKAYAAWGEACVERFVGMFAFALWDMTRHRLFLARDRLGIKPLYYSWERGRLVFASTMQAVLAAGGIRRELDPVALHHHFSLHAVVPAPRTLLAGVRKLRPGHTLTLEANGHSHQRRYWSLSAQRPTERRSEQEWTERVHDALRLAVKRRLDAADVPVGVLLSGGLDSSLLVGLLAEQGVTGLKTFTVGFEDQPEERGSEFEYSDAVVERFQTEHYRYQIPNDEVLARLTEAVDNMAEPMVGQDAVAFYLLSEQVAREVKVVQSGQGADEVFGGYFWYPEMDQTDGSRLERFRGHYFDRDHPEFGEMITEPLVHHDYTAALIEARLEEPGADTFLDAVLRLDTTTLIVDDPVKRVDNMTMAWALEARVPFLDHELVELAATMPPELKLASGGKYLLKRIARGLLPDSVIDRPKGYFPVPALKYVRGPFLDFMREILGSRACLDRGLYQRSYVERLLAAPESHLTRIRGSKLWHLALLELWLQRNVDVAVP